jgi:hypothetical protein
MKSSCDGADLQPLRYAVGFPNYRMNERHCAIAVCCSHAVHCPSYNYVKRAQIKINILYGQCIYWFLLYIIVIHCSHILYCTSRFFHYKPFSSCCRSRFFHYELFRPSKTSIVTLQWYNGGHTTITYNKIQ